jgi:glutamate-1-semialdehyde 2,1-aminomutase
MSEKYVPYVDGLNTENSYRIFREAMKYIPAASSSHGHNYPIFDPYPISFERGEGSKIVDVDGNTYIDYVLGFGSLILGHSHPAIIKAVTEQLKRGTQFAALTQLEVEVAKMILRFTGKENEMIVFSNTGAEATQYAIRFARAYTGKEKIVKFEGGYHGSYDYVTLSNSGSPLPALGPYHAPYVFKSSWGIPDSVAKTTITIPNDERVLEKVVKGNNDIAAVILEPVMMNYGSVPPEPGFLEAIREITTANNVVLIFDEVKTGFRLAPGGAQEYFRLGEGKSADITVYSKAMGGGFPISAIVGKKEIMELVVPGKVHHAGTFTANPISLAATQATINELSKNEFEAFRRLNTLGNLLKEGLTRVAQKFDEKLLVQGIGHGGLALYFTKGKVTKIRNYREYAQNVDTSLYNRFHKLLLKRGIYFHSQQYEQLFISTAHTEEDIETTVSRVNDALHEVFN